MNILVKELKQSVKPFILWSLGIAFFVLGGMVKFSGLSGAENGGLGGMLSQIPKPVLAMFGMAEANIETFGGFYSALQFYAMIAICCYAVHLGTSSVLRENMDKTYEFLFTKPCGRLYILTMKLLNGLILLTALCVLNGVFSYLAPGLYGVKNTISEKMMLFAVSLYLVALFFFAVSVMLSVLIAKSERAVQASYVVLLFGYALSVAFDMDTKFEFLRFATPFKYFRASELLAGQIHRGYITATVIMVIAFVVISGIGFRRKDLTAA
jgi:ABC-2 type transport system permease protein